MSESNHAENISDIKERLAKLEGLLERLFVELANNQTSQENFHGRIETKTDRLLTNDTKKLQRIAKNETSLKNLKATMWVFLVPIAAAVARWFI